MLNVILFFILSVGKCGYHSRMNLNVTNEYSLVLNSYETKGSGHLLSEDLHKFEIIVKSNTSLGTLRQFWKSSGLCPPDPHQEAFKFLLSDDMKQNLFYIGSLPHNGITQIRIHWLLDLLQMRVLPDFRVIYNFSHLDELIFTLWKNKLYPGFELMGNPSNYFSNFENIAQVYMWRNLVKTVAEHYIRLYGIKYVRKWNFETWNEPDHHDFDNLNFTVQGFLNYYDACSEGLKLADRRLRFGGPGGSCHTPATGNSPLCWALLKHCVHGRNFFTGEKGVRLNFISFHKKGNSSSHLIIDEEMETINYIRNHLSIPSAVPFFNDEADPMKNWSLSRRWRADSTYAAMVVKIILYHIQHYFTRFRSKDIHFGLLSNDNAFLSYFPFQFTQRTLLARFQINNTIPKYVEFVRKPVYSVFGLLSELCEKLLSVKVYEEKEEVKSIGNEFGVIATSCELHRNRTVIIIYNSADTNHSKTVADVRLILNVSKYYDPRWAIIEISNSGPNPYSVWRTLGMPAYPSAAQFSLMKDNEEPQIRGPWKMKSLLPSTIRFKIRNPGVVMINVCENQGLRPKKVNHIRFLLIGNSTLQISWLDKHNRCILSYNVEQSFSRTGSYIQLNKKKVLFPSFWYSCIKNESSCKIEAFYRIYAVDYWNKSGPYSKPVKFSLN